jgi:cyclomaltodextrinase
MKRSCLLLILSAVLLTVPYSVSGVDVETLPRGLDEVTHPEWSYNVGIYEVNVRQYTPGGTFSEFREHLPRLRDMGVGILWFMPIHPIGEKNRKGSLGSYYSVRDYYGVSPELGTLEEFRSLVDDIHSMGMYVIIDWVANHSAWDNSLTVEHPDWYMRDNYGDFMSPVEDWWDVIAFDYRNRGLRRYMIDAMKFWVEDVGIDGFRCDVAGMVPLDFWEVARAELERVKPVFMLAEWDSPAAHRNSFDMTYNWDLSATMSAIGTGKAKATALDAYLAREQRSFPRDAFRMLFTSNHDQNSWEGTAFDRMGEGVQAFAVLTATLPGMPLIYSGQEAALSKRLEFFEKDEIPWGTLRYEPMYTTLLHLKRRNRALWNGEAGGLLERIHSSNDDAVFAFTREKNGDSIFAIFNLSGLRQAVTLEGAAYSGDCRNVFTGETVSFGRDASVEIEPWGYRVYESFRPDTGSDLDVLEGYMVGSFNSLDQAKADSAYLDIALEVVPVWTGRTDGKWLYVEQAVAGRRQRPYRQRVYHLTQEGDGAIRSEVYSLPDPLRFAGAWKLDRPLAGLSPDSLEIRSGCAVILRRTSAGSFEGSTTGTDCASSLYGAAYATSEVSVTRDAMTSWDRGFDQSGAQVWGVTLGPYIFRRTGTGD